MSSFCKKNGSMHNTFRLLQSRDSRNQAMCHYFFVNSGYCHGTERKNRDILPGGGGYTVEGSTCNSPKLQQRSGVRPGDCFFEALFYAGGGSHCKYYPLEASKASKNSLLGESLTCYCHSLQVMPDSLAEGTCRCIPTA